MTKRNIARAMASGLAVALALGVGPAIAADDRVESRIDDVVRVEGVHSTGDTVRGRVVNETDDAL